MSKMNRPPLSLSSTTQLASKFFDDVYYNNAYYARVGGISNSEVNSLEMEMLRMISFSLLCVARRALKLAA